MNTASLTAHTQPMTPHSELKQRLKHELESWQKCQAAVQGLLSECSHILRSGNAREMSVYLASLDQAHQKERLAAQTYQATVEQLTNIQAS